MWKASGDGIAWLEFCQVVGLPKKTQPGKKTRRQKKLGDCKKKGKKWKKKTYIGALDAFANSAQQNGSLTANNGGQRSAGGIWGGWGV